MKIATFNVNGLGSRLPHLLEWLGREKPDVACLQELKCTDAAFPAAALHAAGYGALWHGQQSWNGVAILAAGDPPVEIRRGLPGDPDHTHSRYLEAAVKGVIVACLYLPNGNPRTGPKFDYKLAWFKCFRKHTKDLLLSGLPCVLAGDFNVVPTDFDIYSPASWKGDALLSSDVRENYEKLLAQGWTDSLRARHPKEKIFTFWDYFRNHWARNAGLRIDHLLVSPGLKVKDAGVDKWVRGRPHASDHAPAWAKITGYRRRAARGSARRHFPGTKKPPAGIL